jgi:hypothetical protein
MTVRPKMTTALSETERAYRAEYVREMKAASLNGETPDQRTQKRESKADAWSRWFRERMDHTGSTDPTEVLPEDQHPSCLSPTRIQAPSLCVLPHRPVSDGRHRGRAYPRRAGRAIALRPPDRSHLHGLGERRDRTRLATFAR